MMIDPRTHQNAPTPILLSEMLCSWGAKQKSDSKQRYQAFSAANSLRLIQISWFWDGSIQTQRFPQVYKPENPTQMKPHIRKAMNGSEKLQRSDRQAENRFFLTHCHGYPRPTWVQPRKQNGLTYHQYMHFWDKLVPTSSKSSENKSFLGCSSLARDARELAIKHTKKKPK